MLLQLPAVAKSTEQLISEVTEVSNGYVKSWYVYPPKLRKQADKYVYTVVAVTAITAEIIMIGFYLYFHQTIKTFIDSKNEPYYYYFWATQFLAVVLLLFVLPSYLSTRQNNIAIVPYAYLITFVIDFVAAIIVCYCLHRQKKASAFLTVPFVSWACCKCKRLQKKQV